MVSERIPPGSATEVASAESFARAIVPGATAIPQTYAQRRWDALLACDPEPFRGATRSRAPPEGSRAYPALPSRATGSSLSFLRDDFDQSHGGRS